MKTLKLIFIPLLLNLCVVQSCNKEIAVNNTINVNENKIIKGFVSFPKINSYAIKATISELVSSSTISLLVPPDKPNGNSTIASGITDTKGNFSILPNSNFNPQINDIFILEARKRLNGNGHSIITLKTYIKWTINGWNSITGNNIAINSTTTALCIMSGYNSSLISPNENIDKVSIVNGLITRTNINSSVTIQKILDVENLVNIVVNDNEDPIYKISYDNYSLSYKTNNVIFKDTQEPILTSIVAIDRDYYNDIIQLKFNKDMVTTNKIPYNLILQDSISPTNTSTQLYYKDANSFKSNNQSISSSNEDNNATLLGFLDSSNNQFKASYMIGKITRTDIKNNTPKVSILGDITRIPIGAAISSRDTYNALIKKTRIKGNVVSLELAPDAFSSNDKIVVSLGRAIEGFYINNNTSINENISVLSSQNPLTFSDIYDPLGNLMTNKDSYILDNITMNNSQKSTFASGDMNNLYIDLNSLDLAIGVDSTNTTSGGSGSSGGGGGASGGHIPVGMPPLITNISLSPVDPIGIFGDIATITGTNLTTGFTTINYYNSSKPTSFPSIYISKTALLTVSNLVSTIGTFTLPELTNEEINMLYNRPITTPITNTDRESIIANVIVSNLSGTSQVNTLNSTF